jgi:hypothetical protein
MPKKGERLPLSVRVPREVMDVIDTAVRFEESSIQELVYPVIERLASEFASDHDIKASLEAQDRYRRRIRRKVIPMDRPPAKDSHKP